MKYIILALFMVLVSCKEEEKESPSSPVPPKETAVAQPTAPPVVTTPAETQTPPQAPQAKPSCEVVPTTVQLKWGAKKLPATGKFVLESHLATNLDTFEGRLFPKTGAEGITIHKARSCEAMRVLNGLDCAKMPDSKYTMVWTPAEGGKIGQGSVGDKKPSVVEEMWTCNMMWTKAPKAGTKYLMKSGNKSVVVVMGYETGPGSKEWLGGCQGEVMWVLGATNNSQLTLLGELKDQSLSAGPINCQ